MNPAGPIKAYVLQTVFASYKSLGGSSLNYAHFIKALEALGTQCQVNLFPLVSELGQQGQGGAAAAGKVPGGGGRWSPSWGNRCRGG